MGRLRIGNISRWLARPAIRALFEASVVLLLAILNPFEIVQWSEQRSHELWERLHAHDYAGTTGRSAITVIYYDDESLERASQKRPLSVFALDDLIADINYSIAPARPQAIFVDMLLTDANGREMDGSSLIQGLTDADARALCATRTGERLSPAQCFVIDIAELTAYSRWRYDFNCQVNSFAMIDCIRRKGGIPILFADPRLGENLPDTLRERTSPLLDALGKVALAVPVGIEQHIYPLVTPADRRKRIGHHYALYPAASLYAAWCHPHDHARPCKADPIKRDDGSFAWMEAFVDPLDIEWAIGDGAQLTGNDPGKLMAPSSEPCEPANSQFWPSIGRVIRLSFTGIKWKVPALCQHIRAFPSDILQWQNFSRDNAKFLFADKLIIIGSQFSDTNDMLGTAPLGKVPGVYHHAMALDNLIERGDDYARPIPPLSEYFTLSGGDLFNLGIFFFIALVLAIARKLLDPRRYPACLNKGRWRITMWHLGWFLAGFIAIYVVLTAFVGLRDLIIWGGHVVPPRFNAVGATVIAVVGLAQLFWAAISPVRTAIARRLTLRRLWQAAGLLASGRDLAVNDPTSHSNEARGKRP